MDAEERATGTRNEHYNLISVLYHALHGAENCEIYAFDAEEVGDERLVAFFRDAQTAQKQLAERAKELLGIGGVTPETGGVTTLGTAEPGTVIPSETLTREVPPEGMVRPEAWRETAPSAAAPEEGVDVAPPGRGRIPPEAPRTR
jgi:hypothetical protein